MPSQSGDALLYPNHHHKEDTIAHKIDEPCSHHCGRQAEKWSSGVPECWPCWNRRKLDLPAARHWARVGEEFLSNVDYYDLETYLQSCGLTKDEMSTMILAAKKVRDHSKKLLEAGYQEVKP